MEIFLNTAFSSKINVSPLLKPLIAVWISSLVMPAVMVSCQRNDDKPNIITVAWTGIVNSHPPKTYVSIRPERYSHDIIKETGEFVINLTSSTLTRACDSCGVYTGKKVLQKIS